MASNHHTVNVRTPFGLEPAGPLRSSSWLLRRRLERACRKNLGHCWHPADTLLDWFCCNCGADEDGMPPQRCRICAETTPL